MKKLSKKSSLMILKCICHHGHFKCGEFIEDAITEREKGQNRKPVRPVRGQVSSWRSGDRSPVTFNSESRESKSSLPFWDYLHNSIFFQLTRIHR